MIAPRTVRISSSVWNSGARPPHITGSHWLGRINSGPTTRCRYEKTIEVGQTHTVVRRTIGHQVVVQRIKVDGAIQREVVFHVALAPVAEAP